MVTKESITDSIKHLRSLDLKSKEKLGDEIYSFHPDLLLEVVALSKQGVRMEKIEVVLNILFILYDVFQKKRGVTLPKITFEMVDKSFKKTSDMSIYLEKEGMKDGIALMYKSIDTDPNRFVLAFIVMYLKDNGIVSETDEDECCIMMSRAIMDCFIEVSK